MNQANTHFEASYTPSFQPVQTGLRLQDRDLAILYYTWQSRYIAQRQYRARFWPKASQPTVSKRLSELTEANLLKIHALPWLRDRIL